MYSIQKLTLLFAMVLLSHDFYSQSWTKVDTTLNNYVRCMEVYNNELYVAGAMTMAGSMQVNQVARWNGTKWDSVSSGIYFGGDPQSFYRYKNDLVLVGNFPRMGNVTGTRNIAVWNGNQWKSIGGGVMGPTSVSYIYCATEYNGELYVGGNIIEIGGTTVNRIAKWNGTNWVDVGGGVSLAITTVYSMAVYKGELYVGGYFGKAGNISVNCIARWNGTKWDSLQSGTNSVVTSLFVDTAKNILYVGGGFSMAGNVPVSTIATWDGNNWSAPGQGITGAAYSIVSFKNKIYTCGQSSLGLVTDTVVANWDGSKWTSVPGINDTGFSLKEYNGELYVGGAFTKANTTKVNYIAKLDAQVSIENKTNSNPFIIYPNPAEKQITIEFVEERTNSEKLNLSLCDNTGKQIHCQAVTNSKTQIINTSQLSKGLYLVNLVGDHNSVIGSQKIVIE